jgi:beta-xylosidase
VVRGRFGLPALLLVLVAALLAAPALQPAPAGASSRAPVYTKDFPDPDVINVGGTYYAYSTQVHLTDIPTMHSADLVHWSPLTDALPRLPPWAAWGFTWAPSVVQTGPKAYVMYYTVRDAAFTRQCISVASATQPGGPFVDRSRGPLVCQLDHGGSIDPSAFVDGSGARYLVWKSDDNSIPRPTHLWAQATSTDGLSLRGAPVQLLNADQTWEAGVIEGPDLVLSEGRYYLLYGGNHWDQSSAAIGYATCTGPLGPCRKVTTSGPWMRSHGSAVGPSGPTVFTDTSGNFQLAYHAWTGGPGYQNGGVRSLWIDEVSFGGGRLFLGGPPACQLFSSSTTGTHQVCGDILEKYQDLGGPSSFLGYPTTDETGTPDGVGRFNHFANNGSIYWTPSTGAWSVHGAIQTEWAEMGWERSCLGYPISDEYTVQVSDKYGVRGDRRSNFQRGTITFSLATKLARAHCT